MTVLSMLFAAVLVLMPLVAVGLLWLWGGVKANALGYLASGLFFFVTGTLFMYIQHINVYARMDNAYIGNIILGFYLFAFGGAMLFASLVGNGVPWYLAAIGAIGTALLLYIFTRQILSSNLLLYAGVLVAVVLITILSLRRVWLTLVGVLLGGLSALFIWLVYDAGTMAFIPVDSVDAVSKYKPPVLDSAVFFLSLGLGAALFVGAHFLQIALPKPQPQTTTVSESPQM